MAQMNDRQDLIKSLTTSHRGTYVEIGTDRGNFASFLLAQTPCRKLYCVDPYTQYADYKDAINNVTGDNLYNSVKQMLTSAHGNRVEMVRDFSDRAIHRVPNDLDLVYIDGNHAYKYALSDMQKWYPKLRSGGFLVGDDVVDTDDTKRNADGDVYIRWSANSDGYYGVYKAVRDFAADLNISYVIFKNQFVIQKK